LRPEDHLRHVIDHGLGEDTFTAGATALIATGRIDTHTALELAKSFTDGDVSAHPQQYEYPAPPSVTGGNWRVVPCAITIENPGIKITLHYVVIDDVEMTMRVTMNTAVPVRWKDDSVSRIHGAQAPEALTLPLVIEVSDDNGRSWPAEFSGSSHDKMHWDGRFTIQAIAAQTLWIEVLGQRIPLIAIPPRVGARARSVPAPQTAGEHLWNWLAMRRSDRDQRAALEAAIDALVSAAELALTDPAVTAVRAVADLLDADAASDDVMPEASTVYSQLPSSVQADVPLPWKSVLERWRSADGPSRIVPVGAVTQGAGGTSVALIALHSRADRFAVHADLGPGLAAGAPDRLRDGRSPVTWWACDDQGNYSLGEPGSTYPRGSYISASISFRPPISPGASWVEVAAATPLSRYVFRIPLV
jgi:hypothetical protein